MENHQEKTEISRQIDERISALADWRGETLRQIRGIVLETVSGVSEDLKWRGTPVWSLNGILCTGEVYQDKVKVTFQKGAQLDDSCATFIPRATIPSKSLRGARFTTFLSAAAIPVKTWRISWRASRSATADPFPRQSEALALCRNVTLSDVLFPRDIARM